MSEQAGQIKRNLIFNILSLFANVGVGILYTPYLIKSLGLLAYGIVPLALIINQYVSVLTGSLTSALTRFYSIALQKNDHKEASKYLSTSLIVVLGVVLLLTIPMYFVVEKIDVIFNIPKDLVQSAKGLFSFTLASFALSLFSSVFNITLYAINRLDYLNLIKIIRSVFKLAIVMVIFFFLDKDIKYVGVANFLTELIILFVSIILFFQFTKRRVRISFKSFDKSSLSVLSAMASWVIVQQLGDTMLYRIDNVLINKFWTTKESGIIGAFTELGSYTIIVSSVIGSLFGPLILQAFAKDDHETVKKMSIDRSISIGILLAVIIGIICGFSSVILKVWVGDEFVPFRFWMYLKLILIPFYAAAGVFAFACRAWNRVRQPAIITLLLGVANFIFVWLIAKYFHDWNFAISTILIICLIFGIGQSYFLNGIIFSTLYRDTKRAVYWGALKIALSLGLTFLISFAVCSNFMTSSNVINLLLIGVFSIILTVLSFQIFLTKNQKKGMSELIFRVK
ncbi:oligosaccharide flippase family protein [Sphingobacterium sp. Mn56C]|uniref:oligosaccharide flippase family protein n=1 Tax=Sphingobacterium sp. Mn56C TaxID=3395261 RepID=UPI003BD006FF